MVRTNCFAVATPPAASKKTVPQGLVCASVFFAGLSVAATPQSWFSCFHFHQPHSQLLILEEQLANQPLQVLQLDLPLALRAFHSCL
jgi:hypothetical protein